MIWFKKNRVLVILVALAAIISLAASYSAKSEIPIKVGKVERETIVNTISTNGKIDPALNFQGRSAGPSLVRKVLVHEGDQVKAGQLLVQLDESEAQAQAARAKAQLRSAESDLAAMRKGGSQDEVITVQSNIAKTKTEVDAAQRNLTALTRLKETGAASAGEVQEAENRLIRAQAEQSLLKQKLTSRFSPAEIAKVEAQVTEARAASDAAQEMLHNANITAPFNGTVYSVPVRTGTFVNAGDLLVQLADLRKMQVHAFVDEPEIGKLQIGQKVSLTWDAIPGRSWDGVVAHVPTTVVSRGTRSVGEIVLNVDNQDLKLLPNVNVNVMITTERQDNVLTVPREAVVQESGKHYVYVVNNGRIKRTEVQTAISSLTRIQVVKGLQDNQKVALGAVNAQSLSDGAPVKMVQQ
ncbi:MAG: secretion protein HlyD [Acidobacteriaceae bacterium]|nr:secretion protein HlyD [Acidobacteriaceae bacterium]